MCRAGVVVYMLSVMVALLPMPLKVVVYVLYKLWIWVH